MIGLHGCRTARSEAAIGNYYRLKSIKSREKWKMSVNSSKTKVMVIASSNIDNTWVQKYSLTAL